MGVLGLAVLVALANTVIAIGWAVTKLRMGIEWLVVAYQVGRDSARGIDVDGRS